MSLPPEETLSAAPATTTTTNTTTTNNNSSSNSSTTTTTTPNSSNGTGTGNSFPTNKANLEKVESFINDQSYTELLESAVNYNTRLCIERRLRLPFFDTQTDVAQNHSSLYMQKRQRMPGVLPGQIYTYPRQRWRKKRRQYLNMTARSFLRGSDALLDGDGDVHNISQIENPANVDTDSKDSQSLLKDDVTKEWFYDEQGMLEMDNYDDSVPDSDLDYEETYIKRHKRRKGAGRGRGRGGGDSPSTPGRKKGSGRGRKKAVTNFEITPGEGAEKPLERTPGRRGRKPNSMLPSPQIPPAPIQTQIPPTLPPNLPSQAPLSEEPTMPVLVPEKSIDPQQTMPAVTVGDKTAPSPYCDFCLGDTRENKKTGIAEELVSCADCGRSAHPTCLQFTPNMNISVKKYRWQCIECKCCSSCGNSDNDDQLLFCDDCDRGYHIYCLSPPLVNPPEGSWSCRLCIEEFHK